MAVLVRAGPSVPGPSAGAPAGAPADAPGDLAPAAPAAPDDLAPAAPGERIPQKRRPKGDRWYFEGITGRAYMRIGMDTKGEYYFRGHCQDCGTTKTGTCKPGTSRTAGSQKNRGQGRPGGLVYSWVLHADTLPSDHDRSAHGTHDPSFENRNVARIRLASLPEWDDVAACIERDPSPGPAPRADCAASLEPWQIPLR